ncbi:D-alanine--D-alanine ligase, partial [hydrothermal vent metagenome]
MSGHPDTPLPSVLVLCGGPDAEHPVSLQSAEGVTEAFGRVGAEVHRVVIDRPTVEELATLPGEVVFPVLHGCFGEGGPLQDLLEKLGRPFVGSGGRAARMAMDKLATKLLALSLGIATKPVCVFHPDDPVCPLPLPVVVKPVREGSSVGLHLCASEAAWASAHSKVSRDISEHPGRAYMVEPMVRGRELTVGVLEEPGGFVALPTIEIVPAEGVYDFAAKYDRDDTRYVVNPEFRAGETPAPLAEAAVALAAALGVRHLCRVDFLLDEAGEPWLLEANTMPGFTSHSLFPMAAAASGLA